MNYGRRGLRFFAAAALFAALSVENAAAQNVGNYPKAEPIKFITPYTPGGSTDVLARILAQGFSETVGQSVVVEGKPGAGGTTSTTFVANSRPDGYTLLVGDVGPIAISRSVYPRLEKDPATALIPIACATTTSLGLMVPASSPAKSVQDIIARAKQNPGKLNYSSSGIGTIIHMGTELFGLRAGLELSHIPYRGGAPAVLAVLQNEVDFGFMNMPTSLQNIQSGKIRALGIAAPKPSAQSPDVPTIDSQGIPGFEVSVWHAVMAPVDTPAPLVDFLRQKMDETLKTPKVRDALTAQGQGLLDLGTEDCKALITREMETWADVAKQRNVKAE